MKRPKKVVVRDVRPIGDEGKFYEASINVGNHGGAILVYGEDANECILRTATVLMAFEGYKE